VIAHRSALSAQVQRRRLTHLDAVHPHRQNAARVTGTFACRIKARLVLGMYLLKRVDVWARNRLSRVDPSANSTRKDFVAFDILKRSPKVVGIYRVVMKAGSDSFRASNARGCNVTLWLEW